MLNVDIKKAIFTCCPDFLQPVLNRVEASDIGYRLAKGVFWSMAGAVMSRGLMLAASILVARMLGKTGFGELGIIQSTVGMFGVFAGFGLGLTATKHVAEFRSSNPARAGRIISLSWLVAMITGGLMALGLLIFAPWLAVYTINAPQLASVLQIGAIILFINALNGAQTGALSGFEAFKTIARVNLFVGLISFPILIAGAYFGGLTGAVWALAINLGANWLLNHLALRKEAKRYDVPLTFRNCSRELPVLWRFSLPAVLAGSMVGPVDWICSALLVNQPDGYGEMGIYNAANQWYAMLMFLPALLGQVVLPVLSERLGQKDTNQSLKTMVLAIKVNAILVLPLVIIASIASPYIMSLYGEGFRSGWPTLVVVLLTTGLLAMQTPVGQIIAASGKMWIGLVMNTGWAIAFVLGTLLLVHNGSLGLAAARAISYFVHATWVSVFAIWLIRNQVENMAKIEKEKRLITSDQWDNFFSPGGQWEINRGREQTRLFANAFCEHTSIDLRNGQTLLDCGCALGDATPVLKKHFPTARLYACDFSTESIRRCKEQFVNIASFFVASIDEISGVFDVIYSSNTLEHFTDYKDKVRIMLQHCRYLCILVPYNEQRFGKDLEYDPYYHHVVTFREHSFDFLLDEGLAKKIYRTKVFAVPNAWSWSRRTWIKQSLKNIIRPLLWLPLARNNKQILFEIETNE
jgi:O-antigen/teichoic acid export membrane protein/SAM-dependent methyltransferase